MDPRFDDIFNRPENEVFQVVFYPDRIHHDRYLNATRSERYRYNVREVRGKPGISALKGTVYLDGEALGNVLRLEYRSARLVELAREQDRLLGDSVWAYIKVIPPDGAKAAEAETALHYCRWVDAFQAEFWETLEPPPNKAHDFKVLDMMGHQASIARIPAFDPVLQAIDALETVEVAFREPDRQAPLGHPIAEPQWDNNYRRSYQVPNSAAPNAAQNTVRPRNYALEFQRGWFRQAQQIQPVRYANPLLEPGSAGYDPDCDNIIEMLWLFQRELGSSLVFFHEVTIPPGNVEGTHRHIGSEELYYIVAGEGTAYMAVGDDPATANYPTVTRPIFGLGERDCKALPVRAGSTLLTKSGGIHGIRNDGDRPLQFVAFLYHST